MFFLGRLDTLQTHKLSILFSRILKGNGQIFSLRRLLRGEPYAGGALRGPSRGPPEGPLRRAACMSPSAPACATFLTLVLHSIPKTRKENAVGIPPGDSASGDIPTGTGGGDSVPLHKHRPPADEQYPEQDRYILDTFGTYFRYNCTLTGPTPPTASLVSRNGQAKVRLNTIIFSFSRRLYIPPVYYITIRLVSPTSWLMNASAS